MNCANNYCIYNKSYICTLDGININSNGCCDDCILVNINKTLLEAEKKRHLSDIEKRTYT